MTNTKYLVDIVLPVYNEEHILRKSVTELRNFLNKEERNFNWIITIGDNASIDKTLDVAKQLEKEFSDVRVLHLNQKGRGRMVKYAWKNSEADVLSYMDIDLSTDLNAFIPLVEAIHNGYDISIGSRQHKQSKVKRSLKRTIISNGYILLLKFFLGFPFTDAQCGFKAVSRKIVDELLDEIIDNEWFFDTELLYVAYKKGYKITEVPVLWIEDKDSRVRIVRTAWLDIKGIMRMLRTKF